MPLHYICMCVFACVCVWIYIFISQSVTISCQCTDMDTLAEFIDNFSWFFSTYSFSLFSLYIFFLIFSLHFPHLPRCRCAQQVTGEWSWWWWWWSCWRGDSNCWQARPKCSALRCVSRRYKDTTTTRTQTRTITRREAHFRLPSTDVPHSATYAANSSSTRYPLRLWLVTRCCRSRCFAVRCSLLSAASLSTSQWTSSSCSTNSSAEARGRDGLQEIKSTTKIDRSTTKSIQIYLYIYRAYFIHTPKGIYGKRNTGNGTRKSVSPSILLACANICELWLLLTKWRPHTHSTLSIRHVACHT